MKKGYVILNIVPLSNDYNGIINKEGETISAFPVRHLNKIGFHQKDIDEVTIDWKSDSKKHRDGCFQYTIIVNTNSEPKTAELDRARDIMERLKDAMQTLTGQQVISSLSICMLTVV